MNRHPRPLCLVSVRYGWVLLLAICLGTASKSAHAQLGVSTSNPGDPLSCQPNQGLVFLIVNSIGIFTADHACYGDDIDNEVMTAIPTGQGGMLSRGSWSGRGANHYYQAPTPGFTGLDTFSIPVTNIWNGAGGAGSAGGTIPPGGAATLNITLNVLPGLATLNVPSTATLVPVPAGSITGCSPPGNPVLGATASAVYGCVTGIIEGNLSPSHGTLARSGNTLRYTPAAGYSGPDLFSYEAVGVNNNGNAALESGAVLVQVTVAPPTGIPTLGRLSLFLLTGTLLLFGIKAIRTTEAAA